MVGGTEAKTESIFSIVVETRVRSIASEGKAG